MVRFKSIFIICLGVIAFRCHAQSAETEKILKEIPSLKEDSTKVNTLIELGTAYLTTDAKEALKYGEEANALAEKIKYTKGRAYALKLNGQCMAKQSKFLEAIDQFNASLNVFKSINNKDGISNILNNLGSVYFNIGDDTKSIEYHLQSLKVAEGIDNKFRIATNLNNIGTVYANKPATMARAQEYYLRALPIFEFLKYDDGIGVATMNIGETFFKRGLYNSALAYFERSAKIYEGTSDAAFPLSYLGAIYAERTDFDKAFEYHKAAIQITEQLGAKFELAQSLLSLAKTQGKKGDLLKSIETYKRAQKLAEELGTKQEVKISYEALSKLYAATGNFRDAYKYETLLTSIKDTLYNSNEDKKIQQMQFNFDIDKKEAEIQIQGATIQRQKIISYATGISGFLLLLLTIGFFNRYRYIRKTNKIIKDERDRSKELLLNILPEETAIELETNGHAKTRYYENVTVLFTDFKGFSTIAGGLTPIQLVAELNDYFMAFDEIVEKFDLEKIKTIGDAYMCAGGIPTVNDTHPLNAVKAALAMQAYMEKRQREKNITGLAGWELRIGIHTGPVVAGVVGKKKYAYDIWGDTVNIASRMESNGEPGKVNISVATHNLIKDKFECFHRGKISAKNIGEIDMYFVGQEIHLGTMSAV